jgi:hypothetical protein
MPASFARDAGSASASTFKPTCSATAGLIPGAQAAEGGSFDRLVPFQRVSQNASSPQVSTRTPGVLPGSDVARPARLCLLIDRTREPDGQERRDHGAGH